MVGGTHYFVKVMPTERLSPYSQTLSEMSNGHRLHTWIQKDLSGVCVCVGGGGVNF